MEDAEPISEISVGNRLSSAKSSLCESCYRRPKYADRRRCRCCILRWQRDPTPDECGRLHRDYRNVIPDDCRLEGTIPERHCEARLEHLPAAIRKAAESVPEETGLFLWGPPGVGKTYSMAAVARHAYLDGWDIHREKWDVLCLEIRDCFGRGVSELNIVRKLINVDKLFIEDLGTTISIGEQETDFSLRTFLMILDGRLEHCRATYVTTNKSIEELGRSFDKRVASRLQQACKIMKLEGRDRRQV